MPDVRTTVFVVVAIAGIAMPAVFLLIVVASAVRRRQGRLGSTGANVVALAGGLALGSMFLVTAGDLVIGWPFIAVALLVALNEARSGRFARAGWTIAGTALPWTILWGTYLLLLARRAVPFEPLETVEGFAAGALPTAVGLIVAGRYADAAGASAMRPPDRSFRTVARALREPSSVGPFGLPELAAVVTIATVGVVFVFVPLEGPAIVRFALAAIIGSAAAAEAYVRGMAPQTRRAMEAFAWLGEWDLAQLRRVTGGGVPTTARGARRWLSRHPANASEPVNVRSLRIQLSLLAGRTDEARSVAARPLTTDPVERFAQEADRQVLAWWTAEPDDLTAMRTAASKITPADGDDRLRADVSVALAEVRDRAVERARDSMDVLAPLLAARDRLGPRADGILRRTLWRRLFAAFLVASLALGAVGLALDGAGF